ncbi:Zn(II)2Cys6 transcription factor domain-containing protein, partial [Aspergillus ibericus CBS 121593]
MFSTLRCGGADEPIRIERQQYAHEVNIGRGPQHIACENCRLKKLRCNGKKPTCGRCREKSVQCQYGTGEPLSPSSMAADNRSRVTKSIKTPRTTRDKRKCTPPEEVAETQPIPVTSQTSGSPETLLMEDWLADEGMMDPLQPALDHDTTLAGMPNDGISPWGFTPYSPAENPPLSSEHLLQPTSQTLDLQGTRPSAPAATAPVLPVSTSTSTSYIEPRLLRPRMMHLFNDNVPPTHHIPNQPTDTRPSTGSSNSSLTGCHCWETVANILQQIELNRIVSEQSPSLESR